MLVRNVVFNLIGLAAPVLLAVFCIPPLIAQLGASTFGLLTLVWVVLGYFSIFDLGIGRALTLAVAERRARHDVAGLNGWVGTGLALTAALGLLGAVVLVCVAGPLSGVIAQGEPALRSDARQALLAIAVALPFVTTTAAMRGVLESFDRFDITSIIRVGMGFVTYLGPLVVLHFTSGLVAVVWFLVGARMLAWAVHLVGMLQVVPSRSESPLRLAAHTLRPLLISGGWMSVSNLVSPLLSYLDRFVVAYVVGAAMVAYYTTPYEAISRLTMIPEALLGVLFPALGAAMATDRSRVEALYGQSVRVLLAVMLPIATVFIGLAEPLLTLWIDAAFAAKSFGVWQWLTLGVVVNCIARVTFTLIQSQGRADVTAKLHLIELPCFLVLLFWLTQRYGVNGAAAAWCIRASVDFGLLLWVQNRLVPASLHLGAPTLLAMLAVLVGAWGAGHWAPASSKVPMALGIILGSAVVACGLVLRTADRQLLLSLASRVTGRLRR
ncbi:flippase [Aquabacterium sp. OR-4]|uniref:flippase n=1 Tax=Aquabacterium sp. OR-4 TaxID=2978127 RepID=UPI0028C54808|nr:flippase [Aquabacterium sp. OR-4]MDT7835875.1 flippase [Aquabacterium sp. OR-4]